MMILIHHALWELILHVTAYELSCPDQSQRRFLQPMCTSSTPYYTCLFNVISKRNDVECSSKDFFVRDGYKKIRMPGVTDGNCSKDRYQPTTFNASQSSDCLYLKSGCEEEGQVVVSNGTGSKDRSCRCDYRAGYTYVIPPRNPCACVPSEEDCSCRKMYCKQNEALSQDYKCETGDLFLTVCKSISITTAPPSDKGIDHNQFDPIPLSNTPSHISGRQASEGVLLLLVVIMVVALFWLRVCPEVQSYNVKFENINHVIQRDDMNHKYTVINGCYMELTFTYKSLLPIRHIMVREVRSGRILEGEEERDEPNTGYRLRGVKETSYHVSNLQTTSTGTYDISIINMFRLPSSLMDWWNRFHGRLANLIYNRSEEKTKTSTNTTGLIIISLPDVYTPKDTARGKAVTLELNEIEYTVVSWLRLDGNDQLSVVRTQPDKRHKCTGGVSSNPSLTINQTCMGDGGRYCCFNVSTDGETTCYGWKLRVIPQEHSYNEMEDHRSDTEFVRIDVVSKARDCLERNGVVVIKGREGTGKTKLVLELASMLEEKGYLPVIVRSEDDIKKEFDESNILYIFDHSNSNEQYWIDKLKQCLLQKKSGLTCNAVFMVRNFMFRPLKELKIKENVLVDLDNRLLEDDKQNILNLYMDKYHIATVGSKESNFSKKEIIEDTSLQVKLDLDSVAMIIKTEPILGFPLMAKQFCASRENLHLGEKYFNNPPESVIQKIKILEEDAGKKSASLHEALLVVVLAYITLSEEQRLNINDLNFELLAYTKASLLKDINYKQKLPAALDADTKEAIQKAADCLVGDYLTCLDGVYEFIHPYYCKAVVLSLPKFAPLIVFYGKLELVLEYVRGDRGQSDDTVVRLAEKYYPHLFGLLLNEFCRYSTIRHPSSQNKNPENIGHYIYDYWIKDRDVKLCSNLISHLEVQVFRERELGDKVLPFYVFFLLRYMTSNWNDLWIYSPEVVQDVLIIYGLLALFGVKPEKRVLSDDKREKDVNVQVHPYAAQNTMIVDKMHSAVDMLLIKLKERLEGIKSPEDKFLGKLGTPLDQHGNTFFHYLILYDDEELACNIFNICSRYVKKEWIAENAKDMRPIDLAVVFGRPKLCLAFIVAYKTYFSEKDSVFVRAECLNEYRLKAIQNSVHRRDSKSSAKKEKNDDMVFNLNEKYIAIFGADYKALADILYKL